MTASGVENVTVVAYMLHSHLAGHGLRIRHVRDGVELPYLAVDNSYDFNFQEFRRPPQEIVIKPVSRSNLPLILQSLLMACSHIQRNSKLK